MPKLLYGGIAAVCLSSVLIGCTSTGQVTSNVTPTTVCQAVANAQANSAFTAAMAPQIASNSAIGQTWQYLESGCNGNQPAAGVNASWTQEMLTVVEDALPAVLPALVGLI